MVGKAEDEGGERGEGQPNIGAKGRLKVGGGGRKGRGNWGDGRGKETGDGEREGGKSFFLVSMTRDFALPPCSIYDVSDCHPFHCVLACYFTDYEPGASGLPELSVGVPCRRRARLVSNELLYPIPISLSVEVNSRIGME